MNFVKNSENFSKISKKSRIFLALIKLQLPKKWPKNAIKMKISGVDKAPKKSRPPNLSDIVILHFSHFNTRKSRGFQYTEKQFTSLKNKVLYSTCKNATVNLSDYNRGLSGKNE